MTFIELLNKRRSVRKFDNRPIDNPTIETLLKATLTAPSSKNTRSTRLAVIDNRALLEQFSSMRSTGAGLLKDVPLAIAVMADTSLTDMWRENCSISATTLQLAAESLSLGSCWVQVNGRMYRDTETNTKSAQDYLHEVAPQLKPYEILCIIALGYPESEPKPHLEREDSDKIIYLR